MWCRGELLLDVDKSLNTADSLKSPKSRAPRMVRQDSLVGNRVGWFPRRVVKNPTAGDLKEISSQKLKPPSYWSSCDDYKVKRIQLDPTGADQKEYEHITDHFLQTMHHGGGSMPSGRKYPEAPYPDVEIKSVSRIENLSPNPLRNTR